MLEVPRAFLRAERIASEKHIDFVSIGTNDLTQMMFGFSRDDTQRFMVSKFLPIIKSVCDLDHLFLAIYISCIADIPGKPYSRKGPLH